ncbi:MAG: DUF3857 domain-containing protein [Sphingobacteriaceae bacterium]|nr:DUF3857 domain-containing protein [Sphingobacteriaceae bacterium]
MTLIAFGQSPSTEFKISPVPSWVKKYPLPELKKNYSLDLALVHSEAQYNHISKERFIRSIFYLNTFEGLNKIKSFYASYEPDFHKLTINKAIIYRKENSINLNSQLHLEHKLHEKQIGGEKYDSDAGVYIFLNQVRIGDMVELAYTIKGEQPDFRGVLSIQHKIPLKELIGTSYLRIIGAANKAINYSTSPSVNIKPKRVYTNTQNYFEFIYTNNEVDIHSPGIQIYVYDSNSWKEVNEINLKNFQLDILPSKSIYEKVSKLTHKLTTGQEKINAILNFTQNLFYLEYDLIEPKKPDLVLKQGFGDCKSKSLLAVKMLECINIHAWPVLVKSTGIKNSLLNTHALIFDHCVVEFVMGTDTLLFDPTKGPQSRSVYKKDVSTLRYGLRLIKNNAGLSKFNENTYRRIKLNAIVSVTDDLNSRKEEKQKSFFRRFSSFHRVITVVSLASVFLAFLLWRIFQIKQKHKMHLKELTSELKRLKTEIENIKSQTQSNKP